MKRTSPLSLLLCGLIAACSSTTNESTPTDSAPEDQTLEWLEPTPDLSQRMDARMEQVPWVHGFEDQVEMIQWWADKGELAYSRLLQMAADPRPRVADIALAALASSRDGRLVEPLRQIQWPAEEQVDLAYSRARTHLRLGDWNHVDTLVEGLSDERVFARAMCFKALREATQMDHGYAPQAPEEERAEAVQAWQAWVAERQQDPLLAQ